MKKYTQEQAEKIKPLTNFPVMGTKVPTDVHCRKKHLPSIRITLCMPDGMIMSISVFEEECIDNEINKFVDNWFKVTREDPELFHHFLTKQRCPNCGGELWAKILRRGCAIWCINHPHCSYMEHGDSVKARQLMAEKYGLKWKLVKKEGVRAVCSNKRK